MLPESVLPRLTAAQIERISRRAAEPGSRFGADLELVLENARSRGASPEQIALAVGVALALAESREAGA